MTQMNDPDACLIACVNTSGREGRDKHFSGQPANWVMAWPSKDQMEFCCDTTYDHCWNKCLPNSQYAVLIAEGYYGRRKPRL